MDHPGPVNEPRIVVEQSPYHPEYRVMLPAGVDLLDGLCEALAAQGVRSAGVRLSGGVLSHCRFVTGVPDPSGFRIATHSPANDLAGPVLLISGGAIVGIDAHEHIRAHCHAMFVGRGGEVRSGHLLPGSCPIDEQGIEMWVTPTGEARFETQFDDETNFPLMHPGQWG